MNYPMPNDSLNHFHIDCKRKEEQIALLNSMRTTRDDRLFALIGVSAKPWDRVTDQDSFAVKQQMYSGMTNWQINQNLIKLSHCPPY